MKLNRIFVAILATLWCIAAPTFAADNGGEKDKEWSIAVDGRVIAKDGKNIHRGTVYMEKNFTEEVGAFVYASTENGERSAYVGPTYWIVPEVLQVGVGIGSSRYDLGDGYESHRLIGAWLYAIPMEGMEAEVSVEHYSKDSEPWWYQATMKYNLSERAFVGVLGEKGIGWGPLVGTTIGRLKLWASVPVIAKDGETKFVTVVEYSY